MGFVKFILTLVVLVGLCLAGSWYIKTPQPPQMSAQWRYLTDTASYTFHEWKSSPADLSTREQIEFWRPLAAGDNVVAQIEIARLLFSQAAEDLQAYRMAATFLDEPANTLGIPLAQNALGVAVRDGLGVPANKAEAYKWFYLASVRGLDLAEKNMLDLTHYMSESDLAKAKSLVESWEDSHGGRQMTSLISQ